MFSGIRKSGACMVAAAAKTPARFAYDRDMPRLLASVRPRTGPVDVLDAGCGDGRYAAWFPGDRYAGIDLGDNLPASTPEQVFLKASVLATPFENARFDLILCSLMIEHIPDVPAAIGELHRVLKPGGVLVLSTATRWAEGIGEMPNLFWRPDGQEQGQAFHYFDPEQLLQACRQAGFKTAVDDYVGGPWELGLEYVRTFLDCAVKKLAGERYEHHRDSTAREAAGAHGSRRNWIRTGWWALMVVPYFCANWTAYALDRLWKSRLAKVVVVVARKAL